MKIKWGKLIICILIPLAVGALSAFLTRDAMAGFESIVKPPLSPPSWLFAVVWPILYILMGIASYLVLESGGSNEDIRGAMILYALQLVFNFAWSIIFFNLGRYFAAFIWIITLLVLIIFTTIKFGTLKKEAAYLMIPYILWVAFASYLNLGIYFLN